MLRHCAVVHAVRGDMRDHDGAGKGVGLPLALPRHRGVERITPRGTWRSRPPARRAAPSILPACVPSRPAAGSAGGRPADHPTLGSPTEYGSSCRAAIRGPSRTAGETARASEGHAARIFRVAQWSRSSRISTGLLVGAGILNRFLVSWNRAARPTHWLDYCPPRTFSKPPGNGRPPGGLPGPRAAGDGGCGNRQRPSSRR